MNIQEIDKWLDNEYGVSYTRLEELHDFAVEQDLKHREEKDKEIEKLNNIINELEKIVSLDFNYVNNDLSDNFVLGIRNEAKSIYRELQELKGSDKE